MKRIRSSRLGRPNGFTLLEILIVITIIGILAALLLPAIMRALGKGTELRQTTEIDDLGTALQTFRTQYGVYPPSRIRLRENTAYNQDAFDAHSERWLRRIWPNIILPTGVAGGPTILWCKDSPPATVKTEATVAASSGGGAGAPGGTGGAIYELEGDECLVFFLGGIAQFDRSNPDSSIILNGFSKRASNPGGVPDSSIPQTVQREPRLFEFDGGRLFVRPFTVVTPATQFVQEFVPSAGSGYLAMVNSKLPSYRSIDTNPINAPPIAYFSSYEGTGYRPHDVNLVPTTNPSLAFQLAWLPMLPIGNSVAPNPYTESNPVPAATEIVRFHKSSGFQLITAGDDNEYGLGGRLPRVATAPITNTDLEFDDRTNFTDSKTVGVFDQDSRQN